MHYDGTADNQFLVGPVVDFIVKTHSLIEDNWKLYMECVLVVDFHSAHPESTSGIGLTVWLNEYVCHHFEDGQSLLVGFTDLYNYIYSESLRI